MGAGSPDFEPSTTAFTGHNQGAGYETEQPGCELGPMWDSGTYKARTLASMLGTTERNFRNHLTLTSLLLILFEVEEGNYRPEKLSNVLPITVITNIPIKALGS